MSSFMVLGVGLWLRSRRPGRPIRSTGLVVAPEVFGPSAALSSAVVCHPSSRGSLIRMNTKFSEFALKP